MRQLFVALLVLFPSVANAAGTIILLIDVSSSIDETQMRLQIDGYLNAVTHISTLQYVNLEVILFGTEPEHISSGNSKQAAAAFATLEILPPAHRGATCLTDALKYVEKLLPELPQPVILDISGDGEANCMNNHFLEPTLDRIAAADVRVNTLYVNNDTMQISGPDAMNPQLFYRNLVRNNGFAIVANNFDDFELALWEKLVLEVSQLKERAAVTQW